MIVCFLYQEKNITITDSTTLGYFNRPKSRREHRMASIRKEDIEMHVKRFMIVFGIFILRYLFLLLMAIYTSRHLKDF